MEFLIAAILVDAVCTYVCFQKGKKGLGWVGVVGLFGLAPLLLWFPLAGSLGPAAPDSAWARARTTSPPSTTAQAPQPYRDAQPSREGILTFLTDARDRGVIDEEIYRRLVAMLQPPTRPAPEAAPPVSPQPALTAPATPPTPPQPMPTPPVIPVRMPPVAAPPIIPVKPAPAPARPAPRVPTKAEQTRARLWRALVSDVALHGFSYLGVLLTFVAVLGFLLFSFADLPDASQPFVELIIALIFFGWAWLLRRQDAERVANGMELIGGMVLPLVVFASLVDNAPFPPDFEGGGLIVALALSGVGLAVLYSLYTARHPESILRYLVGPLLWLAALTIGFAFKTDEPLVGDAITRLVSPQPALASAAIALSLLACQRKPDHRLAQPTVISALIGVPVAYLITVALAFGEDWALAWPLVVLGAGTLVSAEILARWHHKEAWVPVMRPLLLAGVLTPLTPSLEFGWAGLIVAVAYVALFELDRRQTPTAGLGQLLAGVGAVTGAVMAAADPWPSLIAFTLLTAWAHVRRLDSWEPPEIGVAFTAAAALLPIGIGGALLQLIDPAFAWLAMAAILASSSAVVRALKSEDGFWPVWIGAAALAVSLGALRVWIQGGDNQVLGAPTLLLSALAISLLARWAVARIWVAAALLIAALAMALETADVASDQQSMAWAGIGLSVVVATNIFRRFPASHLAAIGHLLSAGSLLTLPSGSARSVVVGGWALGWIASTIGGELEGDSLSALLERLGSTVDGEDQTDFARASGWIAPILMVASIPPAVITLANLWDEFVAHRSWSGVALAGVSLVYAGVARMVASRKPLSRILATSAVVTSLLGIGMSLTDSWPTIIASAVMIAAVAVLGRELRLSWFVWAAWLVSVGLVALLGERAGVEDTSLSQVTLAWGAIMLVGGLAADDILTTRRQPLGGLRVPWLQPPVFIGALVFSLSLVHVFLQPPERHGWWAIGAAAICFAVAVLLRAGSVTVLGYGLLTVGITAVSHRTLLDEPWLYVIPAAVFVAAAWIFERFQSSDVAANDWLRWDLPPLVVAHLVGLLALGLTLDMSTVTPTALAFGGLSLVVGVWKRGRPWVEAGNLLILVAAYDAGPEWLALALVTTSVRAVIFAWRSEGVERLTYQLIGAGSAGWAWLAVVSWQGYSGAEAVGYSALMFGGLTLALGIASLIWEIRKDTLTVWGGLGVFGVVIAAITDFGLEGSDGPWLALGLGMVAVGGGLVAWKAEGTERLVYLLTGATSAGWAWLAVTKWQGYSGAEAVGYSALMFGGLTLALGIASLIWEIRKDTLTVWGGLGVFGVVIAAITDFGLEESGGPWLALGLVMVAIRGGLGAWRSVGVERLVYQVLGAMSAGWAWLAVLSWQGDTPAEAVGYSSMAFGGLALGLAVASRVIDIKRDTLAVWGGLAAGGVFVAGVIGFGLEEPERIGPWLAIGFGVLALAMELAWRKLDPALRVLTVGVTAFAWLALIIGLGWDLSTSVRVSAVVFGLLAVVVAEVGRLQLRGEVAEPGDLGLPVARTWGGLAAAGVVIAALGYEGNAANGYAIASGLATLSVGLARGASPLRLGRLREVAAITALAALNYAADSTGWSESVIATVLVVLAVAAMFSSLVLWRQQKTTTWVTPLVVLAVVINLETIFFARQAWPDRAMAVAVLISIGVQSIAIGTSRSLPSVLALGPPALGLAFILAVGEGVSGNALWYTVPIALVLLAEVEILRATRRAAGAPPGQDAVVLEWVGIGLLATPPLVEMFTNSLIYGLVAFATAGAILIWAVLTKVRRRTVTAACLALATAVLMIFAAASAAAPESAAFWILAGGIGFAVMLVAALVEAYRTRRGQVMSRLDQLMDGWE